MFTHNTHDGGRHTLAVIISHAVYHIIVINHESGTSDGTRARRRGKRASAVDRRRRRRHSVQSSLQKTSSGICVNDATFFFFHNNISYTSHNITIQSLSPDPRTDRGRHNDRECAHVCAAGSYQIISCGRASTQSLETQQPNGGLSTCRARYRRPRPWLRRRWRWPT